MKLYEKKDHLIKKNPNLTQEQKLEIIELLGKHPSYENKIDWNRNNSLTYKDFLNILRPLYLNELDIRGLVKGEDYDLLLNKQNEQLYVVYTYEASKILASNSVEPKIWTEIPNWCGREEFVDEAHAFGHFDSEHGNLKPGAKWCISMQTSDYYWNEYEEKFIFFFWFRDKKSLYDSDKKIAIGIDKRNWEVSVVYDDEDNKYDMDLPSYIKKAIYKYMKPFKEEKRKELLKTFTFNPNTRRYDYNGDLSSIQLKNFVSEDKDGFTINFGKIRGIFDCSHLRLTSLKGAPKEVGGSFYCYYNQLTSLEGAPQVVGGNFICSFSQLTSLEGAPQKVGGNFGCTNNQLISLEGAPKEVGRNFDCYHNQLTSLKGSPQKIGGSFDCFSNNLTSLEGAPKEVGGNFDCRQNPNLDSLEGIGEVKGEIYKDF